MDSAPETTEQEETQTRKGFHPELLALSRIVRIFEEMEPAARRRGMAWLASIYGEIQS